MKALWAALAVATASFVTPSHAGMITLTEGDFAIAPLSSEATGTGSSTVTTESPGGNPGAFRQIALRVGVFQSEAYFETVAGVTFNPSIQGAVLSAILSYDVWRVATSNAGATLIARGVAAKQGGVLYKTFRGTTTSTSPAAFTAPDLVTLFPAINWASGGLIEFGFGDGVSSGRTPFTLTGGYDNLQVEIEFDETTVPVPASAWLIAGGLGLLVARRKAIWR